MTAITDTALIGILEVYQLLTPVGGYWVLSISAKEHSSVKYLDVWQEAASG